MVDNETKEQIEITEDNFEEYFFDVRKHDPERGQILARYMTKAEFIDGYMKRNVISLLTTHENAGNTAPQVMRKLGLALEEDSIRMCREIAEDLMSGMSEDEVAEKAYPFTLECFFYAKKENVPTDDPHWDIVSINNLDKFLDENEVESSEIVDNVEIKTKIIFPEDEEKNNIEDDSDK
jgi:hypothetical protein